ncbi:MAG: ABC transporter ATP-binding protein [Candidatus Dojkabacteria bacterium]
MLIRAVKYVYKADLATAIARDIATIVTIALDMYLINVAGQFIDATIPLLSEWKSFDFTNYFYTESFQYLLIGLAGWIVTQSLNNLRTYLYNKLWEKTRLNANRQILTKIESENLQEVEQKEFRELFTFVENYSVQRLFDTYAQLSDTLKNGISMLSALLILGESMGASVILLALFGIAEPFVQYWGERKNKKYRLANVEGTKRSNYLWNVASDVNAFSELKVDGIIGYLKKKYHHSEESFSKGIIYLNKHYLIDNSFWAMVGQILQKGYVVYVLMVAIVKRFTIGHFQALFNYANSGYNSSYQLWRSALKMLDNLSYAEKLFEFYDYEGFGDITNGDKLLAKGTPTLQFLKLDFQYPGEKNKILENLDFTIKPGERVAFVGGDGSGKSSLVKILCGLYEIVAGDYVIGDYSIRELRRGELKRKIGVIFQDFVRYHMSIAQNITLSAEKENINHALLQQVMKVSLVDKFMDKEGLNLDQILGKYFDGGREVSPGYWQRIAIARMLYRNREINIMDEPFTFIDGPSRAKILDNIFEFLGPDRTLIYITRDTDQLKKFDRVIYFKNGKIVESGGYKELVAKKGKFYKEIKFNK